MKITTKAPANIAFIKYWGKKDKILRLPANNSISMSLSNIFTITTVEFSKGLTNDKIEINGGQLNSEEEERIVKHLDKIRFLAKIKDFARVVTKNNFPKGTGIASSASGFAALTLAASKSAGLNLSEKELSIIARQGSGSACRSIPDGFTEWIAGNSSETSFAHSIFPANWWKICDITVLISKTSKKVSSSEGHDLAESSPFYPVRIADMENKVSEIKKALKEKNFEKFGEILEEEAINMHAVMMTSRPAILYWLPKTLELILLIREWRSNNLPIFFTIDAGPSVHLICEKENEMKVTQMLSKSGFKDFIVNNPSSGAKLVDDNLF